MLSVARGSPLAVAMRRAEMIECDHCNPGLFEAVLRIRGYAEAIWLRTVSGGDGRPLTGD